MSAEETAAPPPDRSRPRVATLTAIVICAGVLSLFFAPAFLGRGQFIYRDTGRMHAPMKRLVAMELSRGRLAQWNPYNALGTPLVAGAVDAVQHPFNLLFLLLPFEAAFTAWTVLSYLLAAAGGYAWARTLRRGRPAAVCAALAFALSGALVSASDNLQYLTAYAAVPWLLAAGERFVGSGGPGWAALVALASGLCAAAGDPQSWGLAAVGAVGLPLLGAARGERRAALRRAPLGLAAAAIGAAPFILPVVLWLPLSTRATELSQAEVRRWNLHPLRLLEAIAPGLFRSDPGDPLTGPFQAYCGNEETPIPWFLSIYCGASVVALAVLGARRSRRAAIALAAGAVLAWASLGRYGGFDRVAGWIPLLGRFRFAEKLFLWPSLLACLAAAFGVDALAGAGRSARRFALMTGVAALGSAAALALATFAPGSLARWLALPGAADAAGALVLRVREATLHMTLVLGLLALCAQAVALGRLQRRTAPLLAAVVVADLMGANVSAYVLGVPDAGPTPLAAPLLAQGTSARVATPFSTRDDRWPELNRVENASRWGRRTLLPSWNAPMRIGNSGAYLGMHEARRARAEASLAPAALLAAQGLWGVGNLLVPGNPGNAVRAGLPPPFRVEAADLELPAFLIEAPHRERVYLEHRVASVDAEGAFAFVAGGGRGGGSVVEAVIPEPLVPGAGAARLTVDEPGHTEVEARTAGPALLVLNDAFAPGWSATLDGRPAEIVRTNWLVRGVFIGPGDHRLVFRYRTPGLCAGWLAAAAGALLLAAWALAARRATPRPTASARPA